MDAQLEKKMCTSDRNQGGGHTTVRRYGKCSEPRYNARIYKKDEEMSNVYSSD